MSTTEQDKTLLDIVMASTSLVNIVTIDHKPTLRTFSKFITLTILFLNLSGLAFLVPVVNNEL